MSDHYPTAFTHGGVCRCGRTIVVGKCATCGRWARWHEGDKAYCFDCIKEQELQGMVKDIMANEDRLIVAEGAGGALPPDLIVTFGDCHYCHAPVACAISSKGGPVTVDMPPLSFLRCAGEQWRPTVHKCQPPQTREQN